MSDPAEHQIAALFPGRWNRNYVATKLRTDPLYTALADTLGHSPFPLLDLGCGLGLLAFFLRSRGIEVPILGLDYDAGKIDSARQAAEKSGRRDLSFAHHDARTGLPEHHGNVSILDILQFFTPSEQENLLQLAASRVLPGGKLVIRSGLRDGSLRFKVTVLGDLLAKATFWMKAAPTHYPTREDFERVLSPFGSVEVTSLWGKTPFNNYLIVLSRPI
ncbi:methyltransferase domain-containing protein [Luteolibacter yonseiensis]|uniref:Methyltransferase domain-containing protein n=1 Tax=Luteolibacter yonseiensis TaxID=1144680 RepID=A0A934VDP3_9BACT|nr:class I SAM-dependent methyltransferase [Luteolibacter yonseiensis]MBK1817764.1 methyltransferase domain-containing protein [Luteolibacter yonseiensis]